MKPKNFPGRKNLRRARAGRPPTVDFEERYGRTDMTIRVGSKMRDAHGCPKDNPIGVRD
jgi:hypothetical protein